MRLSSDWLFVQKYRSRLTIEQNHGLNQEMAVQFSILKAQSSELARLAYRMKAIRDIFSGQSAAAFCSDRWEGTN
jgi:hypothetical protein